MKRKYLFFLSLLLLVPTVSYGAWPTDSSRSKTWGNETLTSSDLHGQFDIIHTWLNDAFNASSGHDHDGTTNQGPKIPLTSLTIGSQAQGDVIYASSASAWARLGAGTSGQFLKTQGAGANPTWSNVVIKHYRRELLCTQASSTTISVSPGELEVNGAAVEKTSSTTLTLGTAGDWAGGASLRATSTYGYIGVDSSGNIKMHTTAPSHSDYALSSTSGIKRYASWSSTTYRIIGWFYMNSTGSGELFSYEVSNLKDGSVPNTAVLNSSSSVNSSSTTATNDTPALLHFYSSGRPVRIIYDAQVGSGTATAGAQILINLDSSDLTETARSIETYGDTTTEEVGLDCVYQSTPSQGTRTIQGRYMNDNDIGAGTIYINKRIITVDEI